MAPLPRFHDGVTGEVQAACADDLTPGGPGPGYARVAAPGLAALVVLVPRHGWPAGLLSLPRPGPHRRRVTGSPALTFAATATATPCSAPRGARPRWSAPGSRRGRRRVYGVLHGLVLPVWRGMGSRPRRALSRLGGAAVV